MPLYSFEGVSPTVHPEAWIAPTATLIGDVVVEKGASVWYGAVIRADYGRIVIGEGANIQDNSVIHSGTEPTEIGRNVTVGHLCLVHDCTVGEQALIGNGSTVLDRSDIGARAMIAAGSTVTPNTQVPAEHMAMGSPAKKIVPLSDSARGWVDYNAALYQELSQRHAKGTKPVD
ncbi:gamma carbonic anhydrase family protein [Amycolatopsis acidicola]|uniref:Gamma carbonic anhydrase family protein n=1 Tax=Amycolatopsis acidicola TaxID=2596893 RepID=A0A5N0UU92_9PSEU|nr:gamma carbonic anhydrase family protein [Amycolatopsis acidicola]KAA9154936.1 gamma carbonic anhydrase family protein [Amycolatopsis acidicola]